MCVALIGGMKRLEAHYLENAARLGIDLRVFNESETNIGRKIKGMDAIVIFTNKVSHRLRNEALKTARANGIPSYWSIPAASALSGNASTASAAKNNSHHL